MKITGMYIMAAAIAVSTCVLIGMGLYESLHRRLNEAFSTIGTSRR